MANPVVHWEVVSKDGKKTQELYSKLFGRGINTDNPMDYGFVDTKGDGDLGINGGIPGEGDPRACASSFRWTTCGPTLTRPRAWAARP